MESSKSLQLHHFGYLTTSIATELKMFSKIGFECSYEPTVDRDRGIEIAFLTIPETSTAVEIIRPLDFAENQVNNSKDFRLSKSLKDLMSKRPGLYHMGFTVQDPDFMPSSLRLRSISSREPAIALGGRCVEFFLTPTGAIFELIFER